MSIHHNKALASLVRWEPTEDGALDTMEVDPVGGWVSLDDVRTLLTSEEWTESKDEELTRLRHEKENLFTLSSEHRAIAKTDTYTEEVTVFIQLPTKEEQDEEGAWDVGPMIKVAGWLWDMTCDPCWFEYGDTDGLVVAPTEGTGGVVVTGLGGVATRLREMAESIWELPYTTSTRRDVVERRITTIIRKAQLDVMLMHRPWNYKLNLVFTHDTGAN
jgi:hypothetical protein